MGVLWKVRRPGSKMGKGCFYLLAIKGYLANLRIPTPNCGFSKAGKSHQWFFLTYILWPNNVLFNFGMSFFQMSLKQCGLRNTKLTTFHPTRKAKIVPNRLKNQPKICQSRSKNQPKVCQNRRRGLNHFARTARLFVKTKTHSSCQRIPWPWWLIMPKIHLCPQIW